MERKIRFTEWERQRDLPSTISFPNCSQEVGLGQVKAKNQRLSLTPVWEAGVPGLEAPLTAGQCPTAEADAGLKLGSLRWDQAYLRTGVYRGLNCYTNATLS